MNRSLPLLRKTLVSASRIHPRSVSSHTMDKSSYLRDALDAKKPGIGFWLTMPKGIIVKTILQGGGFNWVLIDAEHGQITDHDYHELVNAASSSGATPIIRVPNAEEWMIKRALDAGAHGIMTPMCHTVEDAKKIVAWNKYPPLGTRGYGPMFSAHAYGRHLTDINYAAEADKNLMVIVQIESKPGLANVEEIAKVEGLDCIFIGPFDLSKFMGVQFGGKEHEDAIAKILKAAKAAGKIAAIFCTSGVQAKARLEQGFDMVSICTDVSAITNEMDRQLAATLGVEPGAARSAY